MRISCFALAALLGFGRVFAGRAVRRADSALAPWVSEDSNGKPITYTPVLTTVSGVATTLNPFPSAFAVTTTNEGGSPRTSSNEGAVPTATNGAGGAFHICSNPNGPNAPFCEPVNGDVLYTGETSYVTWDPVVLDGNASVYIQLNYVNASIGGVQAFQSAQVLNSQGFIALTIDSAWLQSQNSNNLTFYITSNNGHSLAGPTIMIMNRPPVYNQHPPTPLPTGQALYIALPSVFGFIILCVCGSYIWNRKARKIGLGNIMGRRRGYGVGKSRRQRLRLGKNKAAIRLREQELTTGGQYRDIPAQAETKTPPHRRTDSEALGSLAGTPPEERRPRENYFQDEIRRQQEPKF